MPANQMEHFRHSMPVPMADRPISTEHPTVLCPTMPHQTCATVHPMPTDLSQTAAWMAATTPLLTLMPTSMSTPPTPARTSKQKN